MPHTLKAKPRFWKVVIFNQKPQFSYFHWKFFNKILNFLIILFSRIIEENVAVHPSSPIRWIFETDFWGMDLKSLASHQSFRPITSLTFRIESLLLGGVQFHLARHVTNLILHFFNVLLVHSILQSSIISSSQSQRSKSQKDNRDNRLIDFATLLIAVHPIQSEAVISLYGRADLLSSFFVLLAIHQSESIASSLIFGLLALLSKETGIAIFPLLVLKEGLKWFGTKSERSKVNISKIVSQNLFQKISSLKHPRAKPQKHKN